MGIVLLTLTAFVFFTLLLLRIQEGQPGKIEAFLSQAKKDGFTELYEAGCAVRPDGVLRVLFPLDNSVRDYPKGKIRNVRIMDGRVLVYTKDIQDQRIELKAGAQSSRLFARLLAMVE